MSKRVIAAAQSASIAGDIEANIQRHLGFMRVAIEHGVEFLLFPELSLTGYEPDLARQLAIDPSDVRLQPLHDLARDSAMITVVGAPIRLSDSDAVLVGALILGADAEVSVYSKQHLHPGEERVFSPGEGGAMLRIDSDGIALAVCADFSHASHAQSAASAGAVVYAASVLISDGGYLADTQLLAGYALEHRIAVLMANHGGPTGGWACAGRSAFWAEDGALMGSVEGVGDLLLIATRDGQGWLTDVVTLTL